ncbi:glycosyltransferase family 4 protein [Ruegeria sp. R14_0]|uniref:glycosyltransferase family 4 protein n=1 Tax=Ruegeria sp. R14_0 TaxID=2821100 RepID=UPI001ADAF5B2|nr:glycosyltransferase family 4 protein [Ruegeria sp. R14_0]MBO9446714.1 glycosyltransferase family 4 protein [Ruegeria sp. R14_0]
MTRGKPSRVVILSDFSKVHGGASKLAVLQAELLSKRRIAVTFFCGDEGDQMPAGVSLEALGGQRLLDQSAVSAAASGIWNREAEQRLTDWISRNDDPDTIYHVHGYHQTLSPSVLRPLLRVKQRTVMHAHDYFLSCPNGAFFDFRDRKTCTRRAMSPACLARNCDKRNYGQKLWRVSRQAVQNRARGKLLPEVTTVLIHRDMEHRLFPGGASGPVVALPNPVEPLLPEPVISQKNNEFLYVGDVHAYKGVFLLAEAGRQAGVKLRFVGDGEDLEQLKTTYPEHRFDGWQDQKGLRRAMKEARMLVAPTLGPEPFGLAPVEALLCDIPVLASDSLLLSRDICMKKMGASFIAGDVGALGAALVDLSMDDDKIAQMASNARPGGRALSLSPVAWCQALLGLYRTILQGLEGGSKPEQNYANVAS